MAGYGRGPGQVRPSSTGGMGMTSPMTQQARRIDPDQIPSPVSRDKNVFLECTDTRNCHVMSSVQAFQFQSINQRKE